MGQHADFFMGAVSPAGFTGYFDTLQAQPGLQLFLIKAGPGCGKSTLMRRLAARSSGYVEEIHCSSDPDSLDGVILWEQRAAVLDATAPHVVEPRLPGMQEQVVALYDALRPELLQPQAGQAQALAADCRFFQQQAQRYIAAAGTLLEEIHCTAAGLLGAEKAIRYTQRLAARELPRTGRASSEQVRLLDAVTLKGRVVYRDTVARLARRVLVLQDDWGAASALILRQLRREALERGHQLISCRDPLAPQRLEHLLLPELQLAVVTAGSGHGFAFAEQQNIHCTRFMELNALRAQLPRLAETSRTAAALLAQASQAQRLAKQHHDRLEALYQAAMDWSVLDAAYERVARALGLAP